MHQQTKQVASATIAVTCRQWWQTSQINSIPSSIIISAISSPGHSRPRIRSHTSSTSTSRASTTCSRRTACRAITPITAVDTPRMCTSNTRSSNSCLSSRWISSNSHWRPMLFLLLRSRHSIHSSRISNKLLLPLLALPTRAKASPSTSRSIRPGKYSLKRCRCFPWARLDSMHTTTLQAP